MKIPYKLRRNAGTISVFLLTIGFVCLLWGAMYKLGTSIAPTIREHETEHAYCYTAGKMFFVSIACVPKL